MRTSYSHEVEGATATLIATKNGLAKNSTLALMGVTGAAMIASMSIHNILLGGLIIGAAIIIALPKQANYLFTNFDKVQRKYGVNLYAILFGLLCLICVLNFASAPASAQFFQSAQDWMKNAFKGTGNNSANIGLVIDLFFNVLRGLFLLYVGISLVRIIQAARNDEDWQSLSRTPLIIVLAVFVGDLVTSLIVKTS